MLSKTPLQKSILKYSKAVKILEDNIGKSYKNTGDYIIINRFKIGYKSDSCPCCNYYGLSCHNCPISLKVNDTGCSKTPWIKLNYYISSQTYKEDTYKIYKTLINLFKSELKFLQTIKEDI
jgi:hypothetical protein